MAEEDRVRDLLARAAADMPGGPVIAPPDLLAVTPHGRGRVPLLAGAFVLVLLAVALPAWLLTSNRAAAPRPELTVPTVGYPTGPATLPAYPTTGPGTVASLTAGHWDRLPDAPIDPRGGAATVWTGSRMIVWGGSNGATDGASYDPASHTWQKLPASPLSARQDATAFWTGQEMIIFGGHVRDGGALADGARYNPATGAWHPIPPAPIPVRSDTYAVWDGVEIVVLGGTVQNGSTSAVATDVAAYDPVADSWRLLPPLPTLAQTVFVTAAGTDAAVVVWGYSYREQQISPTEFQGTDRVTRYRYDPGSGAWSVVLDEPDTMYQASPLWIGNELIRPASGVLRVHPGPAPYGLKGARIDAATLVETPIAHGPLDDFGASSVWTGAALLSFDIQEERSLAGETVHRGQAAVWDPATDTWAALPDAPYYGQDADMSYVWTGTELLLWGPMRPTAGGANDGTNGLSFTS